jgi:hypothetical protein
MKACFDAACEVCLGEKSTIGSNTHGQMQETNRVFGQYAAVLSGMPPVLDTYDKKKDSSLRDRKQTNALTDLLNEDEPEGAISLDAKRKHKSVQAHAFVQQARLTYRKSKKRGLHEGHQERHYSWNRAAHMHIHDTTSIRRAFLTLSSILCVICISNPAYATSGSSSSSSVTAAAVGMINILERPRQTLPLARNVNGMRFAGTGA